MKPQALLNDASGPRTGLAMTLKIASATIRDRGKKWR
jgi:hypothetical protein